MLYTANDKKLNINYKLTNAAICNEGICIEIPFIIVKNLNYEVILENSFLHMLYPYTIDENGITSILQGKQICFQFITKPKTKELNIILQKEKFLSSLNKEI